MSNTYKIDRSDLFIIAYQLDGLCSALRHSTSCGLTITPETLRTLEKIGQAFSSLHKGNSLNVLPTIDQLSPPADILTYAEVLRATVAAFLSPDEISEKHRAIGFSS